MSIVARIRQAADIRPWLRAHALELAGLAAVITIAALVRLVKLGTIPQILGGDEASTIEDALRIDAGKGPGVIGFDWSQSPILATYPLAWIMDVFGDSVADVRLYPVIFSMLTILFLYLLARESMGVLPSLAATVLLATNVWFLNFSRTLWYNMNAPFFAVGACWTMTRALKSSSTRAAFAWWALTGLFVAASLYGYATGRFIAISITVVVIIAVATRVTPARRGVAGLVLAGVISAALFAPMANFIFDHYDRFTTRADTVSVFERKNPDGSKANGWAIAWDNIEPNYRGLIFNEGNQAQRGPYNARYHPPFRAALEIVGTHLFLAGLVIGAFRWRRTYAWYPFFIPAAIANVFSGDTPDYSRALPLAPFYFLFIGLTFDEAMRYEWHFAERWRVAQLWRYAPQAVVALAVIAVTAFIAVRDVNLYFDWQGELDTQIGRMPGLDHCEYGGWLQIAKEGAAAGGLADPARFDREVRRKLQCSDVVARQGGYDEASIAQELTDGDCASQPLRAVAYAHDPAKLYRAWPADAGAARPLQISYNDMPYVYAPDPRTGGAGCVSFASPNDGRPAERIDAYEKESDRYEVRTFVDPTDTSEVQTVVPTAAGEPLDAETIAEVWGRTQLDLGDGLSRVVQAQTRDGIVPIDEPAFIVSEDGYNPGEPLIVLTVDGETRAYPIRILIWHGVVNDVVAGQPVAVTFDPIAGAARVYARSFEGGTLTFSVTGLLRDGNTLIFDRETETWWQQLTGEAVTGQLHDRRLLAMQASIVIFDEYRRAFPESGVLVAPSIEGRRQAINPYLGYDADSTKPIFSLTAPDERLPVMQRVAMLEIGARRIAVPFPAPAQAGTQALSRAFPLVIDGQPLVLFFDARARSPLDYWDIGQSRQVGAFTAYEAGQLAFDAEGRAEASFVDGPSQTVFDVFGRRRGDGGGATLTAVDTVQGFWFSIAAAYPGIEIIELEGA